MSGRDLLDEHGDFPVPLDDDLGSRAYVAPPPPEGAMAHRMLDWDDPDVVRAYNADRKRAWRAKKRMKERGGRP